MVSRLISAPRNRTFFLLGPRMTGKSTWLKSRFSRGLKIDLLDELNFQRYLSDPSLFRNEVLTHHRRHPGDWVIVDEIQRLPGLLNEVHRLIEDPGIRFALSGSSARKLKRGGANLLAGRAIELRLFALTSLELAGEFDLDRALRFGSLPAVWFAENDRDRMRILKSYVSTYLREEVQAEGLVRALPAFSKSLQLAAETVSRETNFTNISSETGVRSKTIGEYFQIFEDTLVGFLLPPWSKSVRKELAGKPKFYFFDNGVTNALRQTLGDAPTGDSLGVLFEQWVVNEVRAILSYRELDLSLSFWRVRGGGEVDLVLSQGSRPALAVDIKSTTRPTLRDLAGLRSFAEEFPRTPRVLVSRQPRGLTLDGVSCLPVLEFMDRITQAEDARDLAKLFEIPDNEAAR
jgi:predicted AAA+ superfamily ATPase